MSENYLAVFSNDIPILFKIIKYNLSKTKVVYAWSILKKFNNDKNKYFAILILLFTPTIIRYNKQERPVNYFFFT